MATRRLVAVEITQLPQTKAPTLPLAPAQYDRTYQDTLNNILRQYFVTLDNFTGVLFTNDLYTVATLPSASAQGVGARAFVTDSSVTTFRTIVAGGGSTAVPVFSDGTNWRVG